MAGGAACCCAGEQGACAALSRAPRASWPLLPPSPPLCFLPEHALPPPARPSPSSHPQRYCTPKPLGQLSVLESRGGYSKFAFSLGDLGGRCVH